MGVFWVALGGAVGATGRYAISLIPLKGGFPTLTLATNVLGAMLIGFIVGLATDRETLTPSATLFWKTGVCGGFTTFSTFMNENLLLGREGSTLTAVVYTFASIALGLIAVMAGYHIVK